LLVECNPPLRGEIGSDARAPGDPVVQRDNARDRLFQALLRWAHQAGLPRGVALFDAGYGNNTALRGGITALGIDLRRRPI